VHRSNLHLPWRMAFVAIILLCLQESMGFVAARANVAVAMAP